MAGSRSGPSAEAGGRLVDAARLGLGLRGPAQAQQRRQGAPQAAGRQRQQGALGAVGVGGQRQQRRRDRPAERRGHVAQAEGEAALGGAEPGHHRAAAGRVRARAEGARDDQAGAEGGGGAGLRRDGQRDRAAAQPGRDHRPLADPVGQRAPGEQGGDDPDRRGGQQGAGLGQGQAVLGAELRGHRRQAELDGRDAGLRGHPHPEDDPAVRVATTRCARRGASRRSARWPRTRPCGSRASRSRAPRPP